jgi:hypothetical protein
MAPDPLPRLRALCLAFPESHEVIAWSEPTFRVRNKLFAMYASAGTHHGNGRPSVWILSTAVNQRFLLDANPARYFAPPYVGPSGWVGVWLDKRPRWRDIAELLEAGYCQRAPKSLAVLVR